MKGIASILLTALLALAPAGLAAQQKRDDGGPGDVTRAGLTFPASLLDLKRISVRDYEEPGLGFGIGYQSPTMTATVYVYDRSIRNIPTGIDSPEVRAEFDRAYAEVERAVRQGTYPSFNRLELRERGELLITPIKFRFASVDLFGSGSVIRSFLSVTGFHGAFLKARISAVNAGGDAEAKNFMKALGEQLSR